MIHHSTTPPIRVTQESLNLITHNQVLNVGAFHTTSNFNMLLPASQSQSGSHNQRKNFYFSFEGGAKQNENENIQIFDGNLSGNQEVNLRRIQINKQIIAIQDRHIEQISLAGETENHYQINDLKKFLKNAVATTVSSNGLYLAVLQFDGEIIIYCFKSQTLKMVKGVQRFDQSSNIENGPQVFIYLNNQASVLLIRQSNQEFIWMWNISHDSINKTANSPSKYKGYSKERRGSGLYRSNSFDKRFRDVELENQRNSIIKNETQGLTQVKGTWNKVFMKDIGGPMAKRQSQISDIDIKFLMKMGSESDKKQHSEKISIFQGRLYTKQQYFGQHLQNSTLNEEELILEFTSQKVVISLVNKGGSVYESNLQIDNLKQKISCVEFIGERNITSQTKSVKLKTLITKIDNEGSLSFTVLNSPHMLYCQGIFTNFDSSLSLSFKLFEFVSADDCPSFDNRGKTSLCIDDVSWTNNNAFVILIFNSYTFAVLPRLGNSLIAIFNPTIMNISTKVIDQYSQYRKPRKFNELVIPLELVQKYPALKQNILNNRKTIVMHPSEEFFIVSDGHNFYQTFRMEYEPELTDLFGKTNMSYFFVRFCISLERLAVDQDILEKIPQLLTNKLPLFEFEKNAELDEEEEPGQVIMTASQINPFEHGQRRMETNQSFNAEFNLDNQIVLLNLKHLLMSLRWNKSSPINYFQWIVTVINDCFFYFLKNSEPVYAYHALRMGEAYCKKFLFATETDKDQELFEQRQAQFQSERSDFTDFEQLKQFFQPVHDMYDYHNTKEYMKKSTAEKLEIKRNMFEQIPTRIKAGNGSWKFQFNKNYSLLVFYSLIQFRNYQAANFNILFLVFACYIMQRYLDSMLHSHLLRIIEIVFRNFQLKKKSDDYELFLGKSGKNHIQGPAEKIKAFQDWTQLVLKFNLKHLSPLFEQDNFENLMDTLSNKAKGNNEKVERNLSFLGNFGQTFLSIKKMQQISEGILDFKSIIEHLNKILKEGLHSQDTIEKKIHHFNINTTIYLIAESLRLNDIEKQNRSISLYDFFEFLTRMSIQSSFASTTNLINQFSTTFDSSFKTQGTFKGLHSSQIGISDLVEIKYILSLLYLQTNEIQKACAVLDYKDDNAKTEFQNDQNLKYQLFKLCFLSTIIKHSLRYIDQINTLNKDLDKEHFNNKEQIQKFQQKANCIQSIRCALGMIKKSFIELYKLETKDQGKIHSYVWAGLSLLPNGSVNVLKEELMHKSIKNVNKVLKYLSLQGPNQNQFKKSDKSINLLEQFFISESLLKDHDQTIIEQVFSQPRMGELFFHFFELAIISLVNQETGQCLVGLSSDGQSLVFNSEDVVSQLGTDKSRNISSLIIKNFKKFASIFMYLKEFFSFKQLEMTISQIQQQALYHPTQTSPQDLIYLQLSYLEKLFLITFFKKYQNTQLLISQGLNIVKQLLMFSKQHLKSENEQQLVKVFMHISFGDLNRGNKQKIAQILEYAKTSTHLKDLTLQLENIMFSTSTKEAEHPSNIIFEQLLQQYQRDLIHQINKLLDVKKLMSQGDMLSKNMKLKVLEISLKTQEIFGISFNESFFYEKSQFTQRAGHILGLSDQLITKFRRMRDKRLETKERTTKAVQQEQQEVQLSFRNKQGQIGLLQMPKLITNDPNMLSLESARHYKQLIESPRQLKLELGYSRAGQNLLQDTVQTIPAPELAKGLMRNRQLGNPSTPRSRDLEDKNLTQDLQRLRSQPNYKSKVPKKARNESVAINEGQQLVLSQQQQDCIDSSNYATDLTVTRRKNSTRRHLPTTLVEDKQNAQFQDTKKLPQHRKGQLSMAPVPGISFNFKNQKISITGNLPSGRFGDNKNLKSSTQGKTPPRIPQHSQKRSDQLDPQACEQIGKGIQKYGPFNLVLIKKDGQSYSVQELQELMKAKDQKQIQVLQSDNHNPTKSIISSLIKPYELMTIKHGKIMSISQKTSGLISSGFSDKIKQKHDHRVKSASNLNSNQERKKQKQDQKRQLMKKMQQIQEKIVKVQKEADLLNQEFEKSSTQ